MIRVGLVGLGGIMNGVHIPGILECAELVITAICDVDEKKLALTGERLGIPTEKRFTDYRELVACPEVDAVDIATPNDVHVAVAMEAVRAGKPFDCEKPLALSADDAYRLAAAAKEKSIPNMICFSYRYKAAARYIRDIIARGEIGEVYHVSIQYLQAWGLPSADTPLVWRFVRSRTGTGALGDLGSHAADLVTFVTGKRYKKVVGQLDTFVQKRKKLDGTGLGSVDVDDYANYMAELEGGASCCFQITRFAFGRGNYQRMEIYGSKGALVYTLDEDGTGKDKVFLCEGAAMGETHSFRELPVPPKYTVSQMQSFADVLLGKGDGLSANMEDGAYNMRVMDAVVRSAETGTWVEI